MQTSSMKGLIPFILTIALVNPALADYSLPDSSTFLLITLDSDSTTFFSTLSNGTYKFYVGVYLEYNETYSYYSFSSLNKIDDEDELATYQTTYPTYATVIQEYWDGDRDAYEAYVPEEEDESDLDGDGTPDSEDYDDDGDGITDVQEMTYGSDPNDASDTVADSDGDGYCDLYESNNYSNSIDTMSHPQKGSINDSYPGVTEAHWITDYTQDSYTYSSSSRSSGSNGLVDFAENYLGGQNLTDSDGDGWPDYVETTVGADASDSSDIPTSYEEFWERLFDDPGTQYDDPEDPNDAEDPNDTPDDPNDDPVDPNLLTFSTTVDDAGDVHIDVKYAPNLTKNDVQEAMENALQDLPENLADAIANALPGTGSGTSAETIADGIGLAKDTIGQAVSEGVADANSAIGDAVTDSLMDAMGDVGDACSVDTNGLIGQLQDSNGIPSINDKTGLKKIIEDLTPTGQDDYTVTFNLPTSFAAGNSDTSLGRDASFTVSAKPDTTTEIGTALDALRNVVRVFASIVIVIVFSRSVTKVIFKSV